MLPGLALVCSLACSVRPGTNADCEWPSEPPAALDLQDRRDGRHLVADAEIAEELAIRYNDRWHKGVEPCEAKLFEAIARAHSVTTADVARARERIADKGVDFPVNAPMMVFFLLAAFTATGWVRRRFPGEFWPATIALLFASVVLSAASVLLGELWSSTVLMIRMGNHHVGGRALRLPWQNNRQEIFAVGLMLFWLVVLVRHRLLHGFLGGRRN